MKVSFVIPNFLSGSSFLQQPLDVLYAANILRRDGHSIAVVDVRAKALTLEQLGHKVKDSDLIIVTTTPADQSQNYFVDYRYAYAVSTINYLCATFPQKKIVVCGAHGTVRPDLLLKDIDASIIIQGEYEYTLQRLTRTLTHDQPITEVPNLVIRNPDGSLIKTIADEALSHPAFPDDLMPAYDLVDMADYYGDSYIDNIPIRKQNWAVIQASRGCPYSCSYCYNFWGKNVRRRTTDSVVQEMEILEKTYGVREVFFIDATFTLDSDWVADFCEKVISRRLDITWTVETRCDLLTKDLLERMKKANCVNIWLGIESFNDDVLKKANKGYSSEIVIPAITLIREAGINPHAFIMLGMPGDTDESLTRTITELKEIHLPYTKSIMVCTPRYGTPLYKLAKEQYQFLGDDWHSLDSVKGRVGNSMTVEKLQGYITEMRKRN